LAGLAIAVAGCAVFCGGCSSGGTTIEVEVKDFRGPDDAGDRRAADAIPETVDQVSPQDSGIEAGDLLDLGEVPDLPSEVEWQPTPCASHKDCPEGYCVEIYPGSGEFFCTLECLEECPLDWECKSVQIVGPDPVSICLPPGDPLCRVCQEDEDCILASSLCVKGAGAFGFCGIGCSPDGQECPPGFLCDMLRDPDGDPLGHQCLPKTGWCCEAGGPATCDDDNACTFDGCDPSFGCTNESTDAECTGDDPCLDYVCVEGDCTGLPVLSDDALDGIDDDCDGQTDEDAYKTFRLVAGEFVGARGLSQGAGLKIVSELSPAFGGVTNSGELSIGAGLSFVLSLIGIEF